MNPNDQTQPETAGAPTNEPVQPAPQQVPNPAPQTNQPIPQTAQPLTQPPVGYSPAPNQNQAMYQPVAPQVPPTGNGVNAGLIVLQWLTYAFWGWTVLALSILTATVLADFIGDADTGGFTPYGIAAILVLLPISYVCDTFYSKQEPEKKTGAEIIVMVIHAVIFAIFTIGSLIYAVIALVQLFTSSSDSTGAQVGLYSSLIIAVFYTLTFLRTLNPPVIRWIQKWYKVFMLVAVGVIALLGIAGPVAKERSTRDDRLLTSELPSVERSISDYARSNDKLPQDLNALELDGDAKKLVERNLVEYKPVSSTYVTPTKSTSSTSRDDEIIQAKPVKNLYRYELCVTYKKESSNYKSTRRDSYLDDADGYSTYLSAYDHPAGNVCYKLKTSEY